MNGKIVYSIIVPLYNEELVIDESYKRLKDVMDSTKENYEIVFVNDGSKDRTREKAERICTYDDNIKLINFSRNFGHQAAITAGMDLALGVTLGCIGIMGQYIGRIFDESKGRPIYIIDSTKNYINTNKKYKVINLEHKVM